MSTTTIRIQGSEAQFQHFEHMCEVAEIQLAHTLCRRFQIEPTQETLGIVASWMSTARSLGIAAHTMSGIQISLGPDRLGDLRQMALDLCYLVEESGASPELTAISAKASALHQAINELLP